MYKKIELREDLLGVLVSQNLRPREQCISARNRANRVLGFIARSVCNRSAVVILGPDSSNYLPDKKLIYIVVNRPANINTGKVVFTKHLPGQIIRHL